MLFLLNYNFLVSYKSVNDYFCDLRCYSSYDGKYRERLWEKKKGNLGNFLSNLCQGLPEGTAQRQRLFIAMHE